MDYRFDAYLAALRSRLTRRLKTEEVDETISEIGQHLYESRQTLVTQGREEESASVEALRQIGSDRLLADNLIRAKSGIDKRSSWRLAWFPALLLLITLCLPQLLQEPGQPWFQTISTLIAWLSPLFLLSFAVVAWRARRIVIVPVAASLLLSTLFAIFCVIAWSPAGFTSYAKQMRAKTISGFGRYIGELEHQRDAAMVAVKDGFMRSSSGSPGYEAPVPSLEVSTEGIGYLPISWETGRRQVLALETVPTLSDAKRYWGLNGAAYVSRLDSQIESQRADLRKWQAFSARWSDFPAYALNLLPWAVGMLVFLFAMNGLAIGLSWSWRRLLNRRWRPS